MQAKKRIVGAKKMAIVSNNVVENIQEHELSKCIALGDAINCNTFLLNYVMAGGNLHIKDMRTKESFLHVLCDHTHLYSGANAVRVFYLLASKTDIDHTDINGDTALHKVVLVPGAWRVIVALMRCGANPLLRNKAGRTAEEEILFLKSTGYEENLHWLRKFLPGLWAATLARQPDPALVERLLRYWCRAVKVEGTEARNLKCAMGMMNVPLDFLCIVEKYENTNEMALGLLCGKTFMTDHWKRTKDISTENNLTSTCDVNTKDHSYQFHYREYPTAPRPLLATIWEMDDLDIVKAVMQLEPDTSVKYTFESEASSPPKPLFFQLVNPKMRPQNEAITAHILGLVDLSLRTMEGYTLLMEAMYAGETDGIIRTILNAGIDLAARDGRGRTARDHCDLLQRPDYKELIDNRVIELIRAGNAASLESLVLRQYKHVTGSLSRSQIQELTRNNNSRRVADVLKHATDTQSSVQKLFTYAKTGNKAQLTRALSRSLAACQDEAGRSLLHMAVQHCLTSHSSKFLNIQSQQSDQNHSRLTDNNSLSGSQIILIDEVTDPAEVTDGGRLSTGCKLENKGRKCQGKIHNLMKKKSWRPHLFCPNNFTPNHQGIISHLVKEYPFMLSTKNSFGQTPLHYAHIYSAPSAIVHTLEKAGDSQNVRDVFDFVPKDYCKDLCGDLTFNVRCKTTLELDLEIFLEESNFKENFYKAIESGNVEAVKKLAISLLELGGGHKFSYVLFDCLDMGQFEIAWNLAEAGFPTNVSKQYESCNPDNPMCAMMECTHAVTTLRQRALDTGAVEVANLIDRLQSREHSSNVT